MEAKERARLRGLANGLDTVLHVGKDGVGENLIHQAEITLEARELVKGRVLDNCIRYTPRTAAEALAQATGSEVVQVIGSKFVLYRKKREDGKARTAERTRRGTRTDRPDRQRPSTRTNRLHGQKPSTRTERPNGQKPSTRTERPNGQRPSTRTERPNGNKLSARTERPAKAKPFASHDRPSRRPGDNHTGRPGMNGGRRKHRT